MLAQRLVMLRQFAGLQSSSIQGTGSVLASTHMDHSFVVLKTQTPGAPSRSRGGAIQAETSPSGKMMDESFVVLPPTPASVYRSESHVDGGVTHTQSAEGSPGSQLNPSTSGFHSTITVLKRAFDIVTSQTQVRLMYILFIWGGIRGCLLVLY